MADLKVTQMPQLTKGGSDPDNDVVGIVDVSDTSDAPSGSNRRMTSHNMVADALVNLNSYDAGGFTFDHIRWADQSGEGHGPITATVAYNGFTGASFTVDGDTNSNTTVDNLTSTARIVVGMSITGTNIPGGTTVASIVSGTAITISQAATGTSSGITFTFNEGNEIVSDPVLAIGYNVNAGGNPVTAGRSQAWFQIEGHYDRGATGDVWCEAFFSFRGPTAEGVARPFFFAYDPEANKTQDITFAPGIGQTLRIAYEDVTGAAPGAAYQIDEGLFFMNAKPSDPNHTTQFFIRSNIDRESHFNMGANAIESVLKITTGIASTTTYSVITVKDNAATPGTKTGKIWIQGEPGTNTAITSFGTTSLNAESIVTASNANGTTGKKCLSAICIASQTAPAFEIDGIQDGGTAETDKYQIYPKGYVSVKPSGGSSQIPGTGTTTISPTWDNKPGSGTSGTATWFPMLDSSGALFWVPGFAD